MIRTYLEVLIGFRRRGARAVVVLIISGLGEALGIAALLPFIEGSLPSSGEAPIEYFGLQGDDLATASLIVFVVAGLVAAVFRYFAESQTENVRGLVEESLRGKMTRALVDADWIAYSRSSVGDNTKAILQEGAEIGRGVEGLLLGLGYLGSACIFVTVALVFSFELTLATIVFGAVSVTMYRGTMKRSQRRSTSLSEGLGELTHHVTDLLANLKFYKSSGASDRAVERAGRAFRRWREDFVRVEKYPPATRGAFDIGGLIFIGVILGVGVLVAGLSPVRSFVFLALFYRLAPKLQQAQQRLLQAASQVSWWHTWKERYQWAVSVREQSSGANRFATPPTLAAKSLTYTYSGAEAGVSDVSWELRPGGSIAFVGASGSGKTTLLDIVLGLLAPTGGTLEVGGCDFADVDRTWWRQRIGLVMQDTPIFQGTLLDNIAWLDDEPDRERALKCAKQAHIGDLVASLGDGLDTAVGHRGSRFSGGQRQRIALARALYREPWLLVLDEATSTLDAASEVAIKEALLELKGDLSIVMVAHQLRTLDIADEILVLNEGRVVDRGSWEDLAAGSGPFRHMLDLQSGGQRTESSESL